MTSKYQKLMRLYEMNTRFEDMAKLTGLTEKEVREFVDKYY